MYNGIVTRITIRFVSWWSIESLGYKKGVKQTILVDDIASPGRHTAIVVTVRFISTWWLQFQVITLLSLPSWITDELPFRTDSVESAIRFAISSVQALEAVLTTIATIVHTLL